MRPALVLAIAVWSPVKVSKLRASTHSRGGLHDLKQNGAWLRHLPGDGIDFRDDAGDRGGQRFRLSPHPIERAAAIFETLQLDAGFIELDLRDHAFLRQRLESERYDVRRD